MKVHYSNLARRDLRLLTKWSVKRFGLLQTETYISELHEVCQEIGRDPQRGRFHIGSLKDVRRVEWVSHVVFYRLRDDRVEVARILHKSQLPFRHGL